MLQYEIIVDHGETANKCTIMPLSYREDFVILQGHVIGPLESELLLHPDGQSLHLLDRDVREVSKLALIDCVWRRLDPILERLEKPLPRLVSIPPEFVTAYPRRSKKDFDPKGGLATIEALFIAAAFLGCWDESLLREYFFADRFLELNKAAFHHYGVVIPARDRPVYQPTLAKNSHQRRIARGRAGLKI